MLVLVLATVGVALLGGDLEGSEPVDILRLDVGVVGLLRERFVVGATSFESADPVDTLRVIAVGVGKVIINALSG